MPDGHDPRNEPEGAVATPVPDARLRCLIDVARAVAVPVPAGARRELRERVVRSGVTASDVVGTLVAAGPVVGAARLVDAAPTVAMLAGYDVDADLERPSR